VWLAPRPVRFTPRERAPGTPWIGKLDGSQSRSGRGGEEKNSQLLQESNPRTPIIQTVSHRYTDGAVTPLLGPVLQRKMFLFGRKTYSSWSVVERRRLKTTQHLVTVVLRVYPESSSACHVASHCKVHSSSLSPVPENAQGYCALRIPESVTITFPAVGLFLTGASGVSLPYSSVCFPTRNCECALRHQ
jgi:hypothetical protein